jgi:hypothetical protein
VLNKAIPQEVRTAFFGFLASSQSYQAGPSLNTERAHKVD